MPLNLVEQLCHRSKCTPDVLASVLDLVNLDDERQLDAYLFLNNVKLITTHLKENRLVHFYGLSGSKTKNLFAFNGFMGVKVPQYYYSKHSIKLKYQNLPCVVERGSNGHISYFPLELLTALVEYKS